MRKIKKLSKKFPELWAQFGITRVMCKYIDFEDGFDDYEKRKFEDQKIKFVEYVFGTNNNNTLWVDDGLVYYGVNKYTNPIEISVAEKIFYEELFDVVILCQQHQ